MKLIRVLVLSLFSVSLQAETTTQEIDRACLKQAVTLVNELKSEVLVDMNSTQSNKILKLATTTCRDQFNQAETKQSIIAEAESAREEKPGEEEKSGDWFTDHILSGEVSDKKGNERLKRRGR